MDCDGINDVNSMPVRDGGVVILLQLRFSHLQSLVLFDSVDFPRAISEIHRPNLFKNQSIFFETISGRDRRILLASKAVHRQVCFHLPASGK